MFVKQIGMEKALELAAKGMEIKVLAPIGQEDGWENLAPDTLQHMLEGVMFFRQEPALEKEILPVVSRFPMFSISQCKHANVPAQLYIF